MKAFLFSCCLCLVGACVPLQAKSKNLADYPLRIHIFSRNSTTFYHWRRMDESEGEGRANLFSDNDVRGVDFSFDCSQKLNPSFGYETYPARWKKQGQELIVLLPEFGKANSYWTCNLKTDVKDFAYLRYKSRMSSESIADFKTWMAKHNYDPVHGKDQPIKQRQPEPAQPTQ